MDAFGNLIEVVEPDPAGVYVVTNYTYDVLNHLTGVSMTNSASVTQTRSFSYSGNNLMSATNPENGMVNYSYYTSGAGMGKVATRTDAKGQETVYTYDSYARLSEVKRYPTSGTEDTCQREVYYYDGPTPTSSSTVTSSLGHLSAVQYWGGYNPSLLPTCDTTFTELYTYDATTGGAIGKQLTVSRGGSSQTISLSATYSYNNEGKMTGETYPTDHGGSTANLSYTFDSMGRLNTMTDNVASQTVVASASYGPANELLSLTGGGPYYYGFWGGESRTYNSLKQLTEVASMGPVVQYNYPSTGNNGKIASQTDLVSGEQVSYTYDALNRLATAENQSTFTPLWGQGFSYDGFGNLTGVRVTQGSAPTLTGSYDANNHAGGEDANGNPGSILVPAYGATSSATYDVENRLVGLNGSSSSPAMFYSYAPDNKRLWRGNWSYSGSTWTRTTDEITFWSLNGQKLATYALTTTTSLIATETGTNYYFGSKLIKNNNGWVYSDRLASIGKFYPYGMERPSATTNDTEKFTGYFRDAETGNDYAVNRYMSPGTGRFITPDRLGGSLSDPGTWNKYAYVGGDPINRTDPSGQDWCGYDASGESYDGCDAVGPDPSGNCYILTDLGGLMELLGGAPGCNLFVWGDPGAPGGPGPCGGVLAFADSGCGNPGGGPVGTPVANLFLSCQFATYQAQPGYTTVGTYPVGGGSVSANAFGDPIQFYFAAGGGTGGYAWGINQVLLTSGSITWADGSISLLTGGLQQDTPVLPVQLPLGMGGQNFIFTDFPGITSPNLKTGMQVASANFTIYLTLSVFVTSGGQTAECPTVFWQATVNWPTNGSPSGMATVTQVGPTTY